MRITQQLLTAVATIAMLGFMAVAADNQRRNDYVLVTGRQLVAVQGGAARTLANIRQFTLFGTTGSEAAIISWLGEAPEDTVTIVDLHDLSHVSKIPLVGDSPIPLLTSPNGSLVLSNAAIFYGGGSKDRLIRVDRGTGQTTAFEIPRLKPKLWNPNIFKAGDHIVVPAGESLEVFAIQNNAFIASIPCKEQTAAFVYIDDVGLFQCGRGGIDKVSSADFKAPEKPQHVDVRGKIRYAFPVKLPGGPAILCTGNAVDKAGVIISDKVSLAAFSVTDGKILYQVDTTGSFVPPVVGADGHTIYLCDFEKTTIRKISAATGESIGDDVLPEEFKKVHGFWLIGVAQ